MLLLIFILTSKSFVSSILYFYFFIFSLGIIGRSKKFWIFLEDFLGFFLALLIGGNFIKDIQNLCCHVTSRYLEAVSENFRWLQRISGELDGIFAGIISEVRQGFKSGIDTKRKFFIRGDGKGREAFGQFFCYLRLGLFLCFIEKIYKVIIFISRNRVGVFLEVAFVVINVRPLVV